MSIFKRRRFPVGLCALVLQVRDHLSGLGGDDAGARRRGRRNTRPAYPFLGKALKTMRNWHPCSITTDKLGSYPKAIRRLQREGKLSPETKHRTSKYLNNMIEAGHGGLKRVIGPTPGFQTRKTAYATIKGFEIMRMIRPRHGILCEPKVAGEILFVNKLFKIAA